MCVCVCVCVHLMHLFFVGRVGQSKFGLSKNSHKMQNILLSNVDLSDEFIKTKDASRLVVTWRL